MNAPLTVPDLLDSAARLGTNEFESFFKEMLALRAILFLIGEHPPII